MEVSFYSEERILSIEDFLKFMRIMKETLFDLMEINADKYNMDKAISMVLERIDQSNINKEQTYTLLIAAGISSIFGEINV